jgi:hypothetical protein
MKFAKHPRLVDRKAIAAARRKSCEVCGSTLGLEVHHVFSRGAGGPDLDLNLITLCWTCHHCKIPTGALPRSTLLAIVSRRVGIDAAAIEEQIRKTIRGENDDEGLLRV